jgi:BioD-like phosphotransacetylase family protein
VNTVTPRVFIAATRQNDGKTTASLGLIAALQQRYPRVGYIKPVGQRFVEIEEQKIDEDTVLMDSVYRLNCPLVDMSPIAVEPDFTRKYLQSSNNEALVKTIKKAFDRVAWEKDFVLCEGSGHAGVGSVFDLSNAQIAKILGAKVIIVTQGGIGRPIDEVSLNQALFEREGVEIIGVIINKVLRAKLDYVTEFARRGFKRKGLELLGVIPHEHILSSPTVDLIREELQAQLLNSPERLDNLVDDVVVGAMGAHNAMSHFKAGVLLITPALK